jgi:hypothetical protein
VITEMAEDLRIAREGSNLNLYSVLSPRNIVVMEGLSG